MRNLWQEIKQSLGLDQELGDSDQVQVELATAILLMEVSQSDHTVDESERVVALRSLANVFPDFQGNLDALIKQAEIDAEEGVSFHPHVSALNDSLSYDMKVKVLESLWRVAYADGRLDKYEEHYLRRVCDLLHLPHKAFVMAKQRAMPE